jgi:Arc/MetJ-type ribon-helix-helix transcriptional regulator
MHIQLTKPELQNFVEEQVRRGYFASPSEVIEAGLAQLMLDSKLPELDEETLAAIEHAEAQHARGECRDWKEVSAELRKKYMGE